MKTLFIITLLLTSLTINAQDSIKYYSLNITGITLSVYVSFDTGDEVTVYKRIDLHNIKTNRNDKYVMTYDLPTPTYMLNYICNKYDLEVMFMNVGVDEYTYLLINKTNEANKIPSR